MLTLLSLALLIQILYYIIHNAHIIIILFIIMSLSLLKISKNENIFLIIPMVLSHMAYLFLPRPLMYEGFRRRRRGSGRGRRKRKICKAAYWKKKYKAMNAQAQVSNAKALQCDADLTVSKVLAEKYLTKTTQINNVIKNENLI